MSDSIRINQEYVNQLSPMQRGRLEKALNAMYKTQLGIMTLRQHLENGRYVSVSKAQVPSVRYNRIKYNRMEAKEQKEYERKLAQMKWEYYADTADGSGMVIPKMVYDAIVTA